MIFLFFFAYILYVVCIFFNLSYIYPWQIKDTLNLTDVPTSKFSMEQRKKMYDKCSVKSHFLTYHYQELFSSTRESLKKNKVAVSKLVDHLECLGWFKPTYKDTGLPPLRHQIPKLRGAESTDVVMSVVNNYCSFFNYHMIEHIINKLGMQQDKTNLDKYKEHFKSYADNYVIECPLEVGEMIREGQANMCVTLDDSFDNCTLSHINMFKSNLREILDLKSDIELYLYYINLGSIKLTFQLSILIQKAIFPLSSKQEEALKGLGVVQLSSGDYQFPKHDNEVIPQACVHLLLLIEVGLLYVTNPLRMCKRVTVVCLSVNTRLLE